MYDTVSLYLYTLLIEIYSKSLLALNCKKVIYFPVPSRDVTNLPGRE
jgi:hypothetical protein